MSSVKRLPSGRWQVRFRDPNRRERARNFPRRADADRFLNQVESDKDRGVYIDLADRTTVGQYARTWAAGRPYRGHSAMTIESQIRRIERSPLGSRRVIAATHSDVQNWVTAMHIEGLDPRTIRRYLGTVKSVFAAAVADELRKTTPVTKKIVLPQAAKRVVVPLTVMQVRQLVDAMSRLDPSCAAMIVVQAGLGLRIGELLALRVVDVDFPRATVRVEHQIGQNSGRREAPKTDKARRVIPAAAHVLVAITEHLRHFPAAPDGSIFASPTGRRAWHSNTYSRYRFGPAVAAAIEADPTFPAGTTSHDLRHHYVSLLISAGVPEVVIAERVGHESTSLIQSVYGHLLPGYVDRTAQAIDEAWGSGADHDAA